MAVGHYLLLSVNIYADEKLDGLACRSIHLQFGGQDVACFYNQIRIKETAPGTYFCVCGWNTGYCGLQELFDGRKLLIFSVWDQAHGDDPRIVDEEKRVRVVHQSDGVRIRRFGGEGTGGQSFYELDWQIDTTYQIAIAANTNGPRTEYTCLLYDPASSTWLQLVTFSTPTGGSLMRGCYSFIEDFRRNGESATKVRRAEFGPSWSKKMDGTWIPLNFATFTGDSNPATNIFAGVSGDNFQMATGGNVQCDKYQLKDRLELELPQRDAPNEILLLDRGLKELRTGPEKG